MDDPKVYVTSFSVVCEGLREVRRRKKRSDNNGWPESLVKSPVFLYSVRVLGRTDDETEQ